MTMVGRTLADIRARLDELSVAVGPYRVVSAKTGDGPVPVTGRQFADRARAAEAATVASAYRRALRRYDPHVAVHDLVVTEAAELGAPCPDPPETLPEYCHTVAGALFETLSDRHAPVERTVMDAYLAAAERTSDRERLCLAMLEQTAEAIDAALSPDEQATVLLAAAERLPSRSGGAEPLVATLKSLRETGLLGDYTVEPVPDGPGRQSKRVSLSAYRPSLSSGHCPVLPVAVELLRYTGVPPSISDVSRTATGWELVVVPTGDRPARGLSVAEPTG